MNAQPPAQMHYNQVIEAQKSNFEQVLSSDDINWQQEVQFAMQALQSNSMLADSAKESPETLQNAIINIASIGISLNPALKHAYLVPRKTSGIGAVCLDISYMGLLHLAQKSGAILWGQSKLVYENDDYVNTGFDTAPIHKQQTFGTKGAIIGCYCVVKLPSGDYLTEEMDLEQIDKIRNSSKAQNGPWKTWPEEMMRKSVVKRASKYWPHNARLSEAVELLNTQEGNIDPLPRQREEIDITPEYYSQADFDKNLPKWREAVATNRIRPKDLINMLETKAPLTQTQKDTINEL